MSEFIQWVKKIEESLSYIDTTEIKKPIDLVCLFDTVIGTATDIEKRLWYLAETTHTRDIEKERFRILFEAEVRTRHSGIPNNAVIVMCENWLLTWHIKKIESVPHPHAEAVVEYFTRGARN